MDEAAKLRMLKLRMLLVRSKGITSIAQLRHARMCLLTLTFRHSAEAMRTSNQAKAPAVHRAGALLGKLSAFAELPAPARTHTRTRTYAHFLGALRGGAPLRTPLQGCSHPRALSRRRHLPIARPSAYLFE
jgi:hypothetical protein